MLIESVFSLSPLPAMIAFILHGSDSISLLSRFRSKPFKVSLTLSLNVSVVIKDCALAASGFSPFAVTCSQLC